MAKNTKHTPQAQRIIEFVELTGLTQTQFSVQCGFKSPSTMQMICTEGQSPTTKTLSKIVHRFPQLNYDWVLMGIGEMINRSFAKAPSSKSQQRSTRATFDQISKNQSVSDFKTNELKSDVSDLMKLMKDTMILTAQQNGMLTIKIEEMAQTIKEGLDFIEDKEAKRDAFFEKMRKSEDLRIETLDAERKEFMTTQFEAQILAVKTVLQNNMKDSKEMVTNFDMQRQKRNQENAEKQTKEILTCLANGKNSQSEQINDGIELGLKTFKDLVKKTTSETMTEFINFLQGNESAKKTIKELGQHTINKKPKSTLL